MGIFITYEKGVKDNDIVSAIKIIFLLGCRFCGILFLVRDKKARNMPLLDKPAVCRYNENAQIHGRINEVEV